MTDYEAFHGEYEGWDPERRTRVLRECHGIIRSRVAFAASGGLLMQPYRRAVTSPELKEAAGSPTWLCLIEVYDHVVGWARTHMPGETVDFRFEDGDLDKADITNLHDIRSVDNAQPMPAQAADMHAYESWKHQAASCLRCGRPISVSETVTAKMPGPMRTRVPGDAVGRIDGYLSKKVQAAFGREAAVFVFETGNWTAYVGR